MYFEHLCQNVLHGGPADRVFRADSVVFVSERGVLCGVLGRPLNFGWRSTLVFATPCAIALVTLRVSTGASIFLEDQLPSLPFVDPPAALGIP